MDNSDDAINDNAKYIHLIESLYQGSCVIELPSDEWKLIRGRENCINFCMIQWYHAVAKNSTSENSTTERTFLNADLTKQVCNQI